MIPMLLKLIDKQTFLEQGSKDVLGTKERAKDRMAYFIKHMSDYHRYPNEVNKQDNISTKEAYDNVEYKEGEFFSTVAARGCIHYTYFISTAIYGRRSFFEPVYGKVQNKLVFVPTKAKTAEEELRKFVEDNLQAGEHFRIMDYHSYIFVAADKEGKGFYSMDYHGYDTKKSDYYGDGPHLAYNTYENWIKTIKVFGEFTIYNSVDTINRKGKATKLKLEPNPITIEVGKSVRLYPVFNGIGQNISSWTIYYFDHSLVNFGPLATVDDRGNVTGKREGKALVTVTSEKGLTGQAIIHIENPKSLPALP